MPPNILFLHSHNSGRFIEPYGHSVPTPHLVKLARQGVLFRKLSLPLRPVRPVEVLFSPDSIRIAAACSALLIEVFSCHNPSTTSQGF